MDKKIAQKLEALKTSAFRKSFSLKGKEREYALTKGIQELRKHAREIITKRLAPAYIPNDGKQTPFRNHPIFIAQHATATCCRKCLYKWHHIPPGRELTEEEISYIINLIMAWIEKELLKHQ